MRVIFDKDHNIVIEAENNLESFALNHFCDEDDLWKDKIIVKWIIDTEEKS